MYHCRFPSKHHFATAGIALTVLVAGVGGLLTGCGGSDSPVVLPSSATTATGRASVSIRWPDRSRLVPFAANSIKVTVIRDGALVGEKLVTRPANGGLATVTFERVPLGIAQVQAVAFPNADGTGVAQAQASTPVTVVAGQTAPVKLSLQSTISTLAITPAVTSLTVGANAPLTATPRNAAGEAVLTTSSTIVWSSKTPDVATVTAGGIVTAVAGGNAVIEVRETESGKTASLSFPSVPVSPPDPGTGTLIAYDGFDYDSDAIINGLNGGTGLTTPWGEFGSSSSRTVINSTGLTYPGLRVSGRAGRTTSSASIANNRLVKNDESYMADGTIVYYSILVRPLVDPTSFYFGFFQGGIFVGRSGSRDDYVVENQGGGNQVHTDVLPTRDTTFLVYRVTYRSGNDRIEFWINPTVGKPLPNPNAIVEDRGVGKPEMAFGCNNLCLFDEFRIGTTWESVAPVAP